MTFSLDVNYKYVCMYKHMYVCMWMGRLMRYSNKKHVYVIVNSNAVQKTVSAPILWWWAWQQFRMMMGWEWQVESFPWQRMLYI